MCFGVQVPLECEGPGPSPLFIEIQLCHDAEGKKKKKLFQPVIRDGKIWCSSSPEQQRQTTGKAIARS